MGSRAVHRLAADMIHGREKFDGKAPQGQQKDWCI